MEQETFCKTCVFPNASGFKIRMAVGRKLSNLTTNLLCSPIEIFAGSMRRLKFGLYEGKGHEKISISQYCGYITNWKNNARMDKSDYISSHIVRADISPGITNFKLTLNLHTDQEIAMKPPTIAASFTPQQLLNILTTIPDKPIRLLWDRATWHHRAPIRQVLAHNTHIEVMTFPTTVLILNQKVQVRKCCSPSSQPKPT